MSDFYETSVTIDGVRCPLRWDRTAHEMAAAFTGSGVLTHPDRSDDEEKLDDVGMILYCGARAYAEAHGTAVPLELEQIRARLHHLWKNRSTEAAVGMMALRGKHREAQQAIEAMQEVAAAGKAANDMIAWSNGVD